MPEHLYYILMRFGIYEIGKTTHYSRFLTTMVCTKAFFVCEDLVKLIATNEFELSDPERFKVFLGHYPSGGSTKVIFHYLQMMKRDAPTIGFDYYDREKNQEIYGEDLPPILSMEGLSTLTVPVSLFVGTHDLLATVEDVLIIKDQLGPDADYYYEEVKTDHLSLAVGNDMTYFTETAMGILKEH